jgi:hypothetical protein
MNALDPTKLTPGQLLWLRSGSDAVTYYRATKSDSPFPESAIVYCQTKNGPQQLCIPLVVLTDIPTAPGTTSDANKMLAEQISDAMARVVAQNKSGDELNI